MKAVFWVVDLYLNLEKKVDKKGDEIMLELETNEGLEPKNSNEKSENSPFILSKKILIDMDPLKQSERKETAILHCDTVYNPKNCFHFELHWLSCNSKLIQNMLSNWQRVGEKNGLKLVECYQEQPILSSESNPFQSLISIKISIPPPKNGKVSDLWFKMELLTHHGFILDMESDQNFNTNEIMYSYKKSSYKNSQFVHRSGIAFIQLSDLKDEFLWSNNKLLLSHVGKYA